MEFAPNFPSIFTATVPHWGIFSPEGMPPASDTLSTDEGCKILAGWFGPSRSGDGFEYLSRFQSRMQMYSLERYNGELSAKLQRLLDISNAGSLFQLFEFALYLISNNLLLEEQTDHFLKWSIEQKHDKTLMSCLKVRMPTIHAFATKILESALRIGDARLLQLLIDSGVDKSSFNGVYGGRYLQVVVEDSNAKVAQILLENGADVNAPVCKKYPTPALQIATRKRNLELVQALLRAGANVNAQAFSDDFRREPTSALSQALGQKDIALIRILVNAGADVEKCRVDRQDALEWSKYHANDEILQILSRARREEMPSMSCDGFSKQQLWVPGSYPSTYQRRAKTSILAQVNLSGQLSSPR
jgi:ankyrin repeat protein